MAEKEQNAMYTRRRVTNIGHSKVSTSTSTHGILTGFLWYDMKLAKPSP